MTDPVDDIRHMTVAITGGIVLGFAVLQAGLVETWPGLPAVDPAARVLWLGDSLVRRMPASYQNLGVDGYQTRHVLQQLDDLDGSHAEVVVVLLGVGDLLAGRSPEAAAAGVEAVVDGLGEVLPSAAVVVVGVLPAPRRVPEHLRIETNALLAEIDAVYVDPPSDLDVTGDGLHLTTAGYRDLWATTDPVLDALLGAPRELRALEPTTTEGQ